jgi:general secretion pathway protein I
VKRQAGMTLLEVLVASVIMAIAVVGLFTSLTTSMKGAARLTDYDRGAMLARTKMDELLAQSRLPRMTELQGSFDPAVTAGMEAGWRARISPFESLPGAPAGTLALDRIELEIWWLVGENRKTFTLEGFRKVTITPEEAAQRGPQ